jgi:hypothetical protein
VPKNSILGKRKINDQLNEFTDLVDDKSNPRKLNCIDNGLQKIDTNLNLSNDTFNLFNIGLSTPQPEYNYSDVETEFKEDVNENFNNFESDESESVFETNQESNNFYSNQQTNDSNLIQIKDKINKNLKPNLYEVQNNKIMNNFEGTSSQNFQHFMNQFSKLKQL